MNTSEAYTEIVKKIQAFTGISQSSIRWGNQTNFVPANIWCDVSLQFSDTIASGLQHGVLERDGGFINIQCFIKKGLGVKQLYQLADAWRNHFKGWSTGNLLEVSLTHAPTQAMPELDSDWVMSLVRIEFRIN